MKVEKMFIKPTKPALFLSLLLNSNFTSNTGLTWYTMHLSCLWQEACHLFLKNYELALGKDCYSSYTV